MPSGTGSSGSGPGLAAPGVCNAAPTTSGAQTVWGLPPWPVESALQRTGSYPPASEGRRAYRGAAHLVARPMRAGH
eukprot:9038497-Pyramimonas_sp.AAC.1